jgi:hypothetical protein
MRRAAALALALPLLTGCASATQYGFRLEPNPDWCQVNVVNSGFLVAGATYICWDSTAKVVNAGGFQGTSPAQVTMGAIGAAAAIAGPVGGALILGGDIIKAAKVLDGATLNTVTSGSVTATGTINGVLTVPPVTGELTIVPPVAP